MKQNDDPWFSYEPRHSNRIQAGTWLPGRQNGNTGISLINPTFRALNRAGPGNDKMGNLVLISQNMKKNFCGKLCARFTFRAQLLAQNADALFTGHKHQVTSRSNVIFRYITWQRDYEKGLICTCHGRSQCHRDGHDTIQGPNSSRHHLSSHNVIGDKTDHHAKASIKKARHQRIREKGRVRTCQGTQTGCYSDDQKSYLGKGQATDP